MGNHQMQVTGLTQHARKTAPDITPPVDMPGLGRLVRRTRKDVCADLVAVALVDPADSGGLHVVVADGPAAGTLVGNRYPARGPLPAQIARLHPVMNVPLVGGGCDTVGSLVVGNQSGEQTFTPAQKTLAHDFADQVSSALTPMTLGTASPPPAVLLEERHRIACDLHDHLIHRLYAIGLDLNGLAVWIHTEDGRDRLDRLISELDGAIENIRETILQLEDPA
jgi:GAF domain-containing protein